MSIDNSLWGYFIHAGMVVKFVMILLLAASVVSWTLIFQRGFFIKRARQGLAKFEDRFWSGVELNKLYHDSRERPDDSNALMNIFCAGFKEFMRTNKHTGQQLTAVDTAQRAMGVVQRRAVDKLEQHLSILATIGSTSPYVGLFGTVWGIMTVFHSLGGVQQATIAMVAPGISEALIATAMGLFAAIPAVIFYNRYASEVERLESQYENFQEELSSILSRQEQVAAGSAS